jgi:formate dehydrogenase maturation protein FdhE
MSEEKKLELTDKEINWLAKQDFLRRQFARFFRTSAIRGMLERDNHSTAGFLAGFCEAKLDKITTLPRDREIAKQIYEKANAVLMPDLNFPVVSCKPGMEKEFQKLIEANTRDAYSAAAIKGTMFIMKALDDGKTPEEAFDKNEELDALGLTRAMGACAASIIVSYHARGEEFRVWWNKRWQLGDEGDKANESDGLLNPSVMSMKE